MDKKILKIFKKIFDKRDEIEKKIELPCDRLEELGGIKEGLEIAQKIIVNTLLEEDTLIPCSCLENQKEIEPEKTHVALFEYGSYKVNIYHDNKNYIADFDGVNYSCNKLMDLKKDLQIAIVNKGIDKGEVVDHDEILRNSSL